MLELATLSAGYLFLPPGAVSIAYFIAIARRRNRPIHPDLLKYLTQLGEGRLSDLVCDVCH